MSQRFLSRRTVLRGIAQGTAVALGLPLLDVMLDRHGEALADGGPLPRRLLTWTWGNGVRLEHWVPKGQGANYALSSELAPLAQYRNDFAVLTGFRKYVTPNDHSFGGVFAGHAPVALDGAKTHGGPTIDQQAADLVGSFTRFKSLQIGVSTRRDTGSGPVLLTMSSRGPAQPLRPECDPQAFYDKLFAGFAPPARKDAFRVSTLDAIAADAKRLQRRVGQADKLRIDQHLESIAEVRRRIQTLPPVCEVPTRPGPYGNNPDGSEPLRDINEVMCKLVAIAFACDLTRVISFMFTPPSGSHQFPLLTPDKFPDYPNGKDYSLASHHTVSHVNAAYEQAYVHASVIECMERFAFMLQTLRATPDGTGNVLDWSCVLAGSELAEGLSHGQTDLPVIVAGTAGGRLKNSVGHFRSPNEESVSNISLACLKAIAPEPSTVAKFGANTDKFLGLSTTPCAAIWGG